MPLLRKCFQNVVDLGKEGDKKMLPKSKRLTQDRAFFTVVLAQTQSHPSPVKPTRIQLKFGRFAHLGKISLISP
jgi:hypothetical protein